MITEVNTCWVASSKSPTVGRYPSVLGSRSFGKDMCAGHNGGKGGRTVETFCQNTINGLNDLISNCPFICAVIKFKTIHSGA